MLFDGEAVFGVVDFNRGSEAAANRAQEMAAQARLLGAHTQLFSAGKAVLGHIGRQDERSESILRTKGANVSAVCCGELIDREESRSTYRSDPDRCLFLGNGIEAKGVAFLRRLDGTFAAAIWNEIDQQLILTCDWRADCRVYYTVESDRIAFSSWLPLLRTTAVEIDRQAVIEFLRFLYIAPPRTIYRGISSVEPEHYVSANRGLVNTQKLVSECDWNGSATLTNDNGAELDKFQSLLEQAVARRIGRRRAGVFLSSGVDSATVMAACEKLNPGQVQAFTIGFDTVDLDETSAAISLTRQLGVRHHELRFNLEEYRNAFDRVVKGFDQPFGDPASLPLVLASEATKGTVEVITGGTGGDDLFGAPIPRQLWFATAVAARIPQYFRNRLAKALNPARRGRLFEFDDVQELFVTWAGWSKRELTELIGEPVDFEQSGFYRKFRAYQNRGAQTLYDALGVFPPDDCRFESAALAPLPIELPYHDVDLTAYVRGLPITFRTSNGITKILLRQLFQRYYPQGNLPAKKHYFNIPLQSLMANSDFKLVDRYVSTVDVKKHGLVDPKRARAWINRFKAGEENLRFKVWALLVLHSWLDAR